MKREHLETTENDHMGFSIYKQIDDHAHQLTEEDIEVWMSVGMASFELPVTLIPEMRELLAVLQEQVEKYIDE